MDALMQLVKCAPRQEVADAAQINLPVSTSAKPPFAAFDASTEVWFDYYSRFYTFLSANTVPD